MNQTGAVLGYEPNVVGSNGYEETAGSDVVVITAGLPRSAGDEPRRPRHDEREDRRVGHRAGDRSESPDAILIVVSNPLDAMCHVAKSVSGWPKERVFGMAGHPRHRALLDVHRLGDRRVGEGRDRDGARRPRRPDGARRLGDDGRRRPARASSSPRSGSRRWSSARARAAASSSTCSAPRPGTRPARRRRRWSTRSCLDEKRVLPCTAYLEGEYGIDGLYMGVPVEARRRRDRARSSSSTSTDEEQQAGSKESADAVRDVVGVLTRR